MFMRRMFYAWKLMLSGYLFSAIAAGLILVVISVNIERWRFGSAGIDSILTMLCICVPIVTIILVSNLFAEDFEQEAFMLMYTYPVSKAALFAERCLVALIAFTIYIGLFLGSIHLWLFELSYNDIEKMMRTAVPVNVYLGGIALLGSLAGRGVIIGLGAGCGYWLVDFITQGLWTKQLYLFQPIWPIQNVDTNLNLRFVFALGLIYVLLAFLVFIFGKRWLIKSNA